MSEDTRATQETQMTDFLKTVGEKIHKKDLSESDKKYLTELM